MRGRLAQMALALAPAFLAGPATAADHNDGNGTFTGWDLGGRRDANITDFFAFTTTGPPAKLVLVLTLNQGIADPGYFFAEDLTVRFHIDNHSRVTFTDGNPATTTDDWMMRFGGTVSDIDRIDDDIVFEITFHPGSNGKTAPRLRVDGLPARIEKDIVVFPADEFESPLRRNGRAVVALEVPLALVVTPDDPARPLVDTLLLWATVKVPEVHGPITDHAGMPNTSNQAANLLVNRNRPRDQAGLLTARPPDLFLAPLPGNPVSLAPYADVLIFDLSRPARGFPPARGNPNLPPPPGFVQFNPNDPTKFPNGRPVTADLATTEFPYVAR